MRNLIHNKGSFLVFITVVLLFLFILALGIFGSLWPLFLFGAAFFWPLTTMAVLAFMLGAPIAVVVGLFFIGIIRISMQLLWK